MQIVLVHLHPVACILYCNIFLLCLPVLQCLQLFRSGAFRVAVAILSVEASEVDLELLTKFHDIFLLQTVDKALEHAFVIHLVKPVADGFVDVSVLFNKIVPGISFWIIVVKVLLECLEIFNKCLHNFICISSTASGTATTTTTARLRSRLSCSHSLGYRRRRLACTCGWILLLALLFLLLFCIKLVLLQLTSNGIVLLDHTNHCRLFNKDLVIDWNCFNLFQSLLIFLREGHNLSLGWHFVKCLIFVFPFNFLEVIKVER